MSALFLFRIVCCLCLLRSQHGDDGGKLIAEVFSIDDEIEETVFEYELGALETSWQVFAYCFADDPRAGEAYKGLWFGYVEVAQHGEGGCDAARGRVGEQGNVGHTSFGKQGKLGTCLGHLHEREASFHHAGAARAGYDEERFAIGAGTVYSSSYFFAHDRAHGATDEVEIHTGYYQALAIDGAHCGADGIFQACFGHGIGHTTFVVFCVFKIERIGGGHVGIHFLEFAIVE